MTSASDEHISVAVDYIKRSLFCDDGSKRRSELPGYPPLHTGPQSRFRARSLLRNASKRIKSLNRTCGRRN